MPLLLTRLKRGMSFVEIFVGVALLGGALAVVLGLFPMAYGSLVQARDTTVATQLARKVLDGARATNFNSLSNVTGVLEEVVSPTDSTHFNYELTLTASQLQPNFFYEATVIVRWEDRGPHSVRLDTVIDHR
jgi:type II secretory pathway pseudopilin PulG